MELRKWVYNTDNRFIPSFLNGMSLAHNEQKKDEEWFHWKFEQSPYGKAVLACAFDGDTVAGCVAYGKGVVRYQEKEWVAALSYETFVHPSYQGKGLFKKLISLAESEMAKEGIQFLYNFPNANSITGFKHMNWIGKNDIRVFKIKLCHPLRILLHPKDLKISFQPNDSNLQNIKNMELGVLGSENKNQNIICPIWTSDYIKWRFFTYPNREYHVICNDDVFGISMVGYRGRLKCVHILYAIDKNTCKMSDATSKVIKMIRRDIKPDIIEYSSTIYDDALNHVWGFFKVPAHGNFCYKVLDENLVIDDLKIVLPSINAHTY